MANAYDKDKIVLFKKLCFSILGDEKDNLETIFQRGLESLVSFDEAEFQTSFSPWEEFQINERIEKILRERYPNNDDVVSRFNALSRSLRDISDDSDCYAEQLLFLLRMSEQNSSSRFELPCSQVDEINGNVSHFEATADSFDETNSSTQNWNTNSSLPPESLTPTIQRDGNNASTHRSERSSAAYLEVTKTVTSVDAMRERKLQIVDGAFESPIQKRFPTHHLFTDTPITEPMATSSRKGSSNKTHNSMKEHVDSVLSLENGECARPNALSILRHSSSKKSDIEGTEREIMKELVFCMQGIEGKIIKYKSIDEGFYLNPQIKIDQPYMVLHLMELGFLHNQIKQFISTLFADAGTVAQGLLTAIRREMSEYYQAIATLDSQLNPSPEIADTPLSEEECAKFNLPTLSQIFVWSRDSFSKLQTLLDVLSAVQNKRGGEIVSDLAFLSYHGDPKIKKIITRLLTSAIQPFYKQIFYWVVNGEIIDSRGEFFIQMENTIGTADLKDAWDKQYVLRPPMIPKYMSLEEANQILETGRCMNFLHNICHQRPAPTPAQVMLSELEKNKWNDPVALIKPGNDVSELISKAYKEVSKNVLNTLNENFKMQTHFEALRKYMLLGQGDFVHHLLEIIEPDLNKSVAALHTYTLMRSVEDAIFKSNAQFDDSDVLSKLCVKMLVTSEQENVSEAFCLQYRLDGPLNTIFKCSCVGYNRLFTFMWRVKRANYMVLKMWRGLKLLHKEVNRLIPEARPVFMKANFLVMEMVNFIWHFQYYIASEVVEVSWRKFRGELEKMESLEKVLHAHNEFLESMQLSCMLNPKPGSVQATITWHIRSLLDYVQELVPIVEMFQSLAEAEVERRRTRQETVARAGISTQSELEDELSTAKFSDEMNAVKTRFKVLASQYLEKLKSLLVLFSENQEEHNLILLSHRIDFNEFYKTNDARLSDSLKLHKRF